MAMSTTLGSSQTEGNQPSGSDNILGVAVRIENGPQILFVDLHGKSTIGELLQNHRLNNVDLYYGDYIVEGSNSSIDKIAQLINDVYVIFGKYKNNNNNNKNRYNNRSYNDVEAKMDDNNVFDPNYPCTVSFLSHFNKYICGDSGGNVVCNRDKLGPWEKFQCIPVGKNLIELKSHTGKYVCAEFKGSVVHNRDVAKGWERFEVIRENATNGKYSIKSSQHKKYMSAQPNGKLVCDRAQLGPWELFEVVVHH